MRPLAQMTRSRDSWKDKAVARATTMRQQRKLIHKERARRKIAEGAY